MLKRTLGQLIDVSVLGLVLGDVTGTTFSQIEVHVVPVTDWSLLRVYLDEQLSQDLVHVARLLTAQVWVLVKHLQQVSLQVAPLVQNHLRTRLHFLVVPFFER